MAGIAGIGTYLPTTVRSAEEIAGRSGIPSEVIRSKFGITEVRVAGPRDHVSSMAAQAACNALGTFPPEELDLVIYCGSELKDYIVWSAASDVARRIGARRAAAFEVYALCAGTPIALKTVRGLMADDSAIRSALVVSAARENDLIDYGNPRSRFMLNFGAGAGALLVLRDHPNVIAGTAVKTDARSARDVIMHGGGTAEGPSAHAFGTGLNALDVPDPAGMKERLDAVSLTNFVEVARQALAAAGGVQADFVALTHVKRSMHQRVLRELGVPETACVYLEDTGHLQAADQVLGLERGLQQGKIQEGDVVLLLAAGVGYTWSAAAVRWEENV
jgi:3-oxoacyl-[acyl-carrier-protein] synthase-3